MNNSSHSIFEIRDTDIQEALDKNTSYAVTAQDRKCMILAYGVAFKLATLCIMNIYKSNYFATGIC